MNVFKKFASLGLCGLGICCSIGSASAAPTEAELAARLERLEAMESRIAELEARLQSQEQQTREVKVLASNASSSSGQAGILGNTATFDILSGSAWRNLRWTQAEQWADIRVGISEEAVVSALGAPPRTVRSARPRVDEVYYYETSIRDRENTLSGQVSFKDGKVIAFQKPNFEKMQQVR